MHIYTHSYAYICGKHTHENHILHTHTRTHTLSHALLCPYTYSKNYDESENTRGMRRQEGRRCGRGGEGRVYGSSNDTYGGNHPFSATVFSLNQCQMFCSTHAHICKGQWKRTHACVWHRFLTLQRTATHCNTLQHTATHCNTLQYT